MKDKILQVLDNFIWITTTLVVGSFAMVFVKSFRGITTFLLIAFAFNYIAKKEFPKLQTIKRIASSLDFGMLCTMMFAALFLDKFNYLVLSVAIADFVFLICFLVGNNFIPSSLIALLNLFYFADILFKYIDISTFQKKYWHVEMLIRTLIVIFAFINIGSYFPTKTKA
jgi:hypothetical protein